MNSIVPVTKLFDGNQIRVFEQDNDVWIAAIDISNAIGIERTAFNGILAKNQEVFEGYHRLVCLRTPDQKQPDSDNLNAKVLCLNEQGLYLFLGKLSPNRSKDPGRKDAIIKFQRWVPELIKAFRKGELARIEPPKETLSVFDEQMHIVDLLVRYGGVDRGIATSIAIANTMEITGNTTLHPYSSLLRASGNDPIIRLNATQIGQRLGSIGPRDVNRILTKMGFARMVNGQWEVLEPGKPYCDARPFTKSHNNGSRHSDIQILWKPDIVGKIQEWQNIQSQFSKGLITGYI